MSRIPSVDSIPQSNPADGTNDLRNVDLDQFLQLLITEIQNQDPLDPMENSEILEQISQIREISATNNLSDTLASVLLGPEHVHGEQPDRQKNQRVNRRLSEHRGSRGSDYR